MAFEVIITFKDFVDKDGNKHYVEPIKISIHERSVVHAEIDSFFDKEPAESLLIKKGGGR